MCGARTSTTSFRFRLSTSRTLAPSSALIVKLGLRFTIGADSSDARCAACSWINPWAIRDLARHRSIVTTQLYIHLNAADRPLVNALDRPA